MIRGRHKVRASYRVLDSTGDPIILRDLRGRVSITNDSDAVVAEIVAMYGNKRIHYIDTMGNLDELVHDNGRFIDFKVVQTEGRKCK